MSILSSRININPKKLGLVILAILILIQFIPAERSNPEFDPSQEFFALNESTPEIKALIKSTCYDCHSYEAKFPWYAYVAPISLIIGHDVEEGREHLNFSTWGKYDIGRQKHKLEECAEEVEEGEMPIRLYAYFHSHANLSENQRHELEEYFEGLR